jgi:triphosphatase
VSTAPSGSPSWPVERATELLDRFGHVLNHATKHPNAGAIHDVRVSIRRLRQCLDVFAPLLGSRPSKKISKRVRRLLKAAGQVRNLDIAIDLLKKARVARTGALTAAIRKDRIKVEKEFEQSLEKLHDGGKVGKWRAKLTAPSRRRAGAAVHRNILPAMTAAFFEAGERAADASADPDTLHKFRIKTKKFRYTLELFLPVYGPTLNARMRVLRNLQQRLGDINDYAASREVLKNYRVGHDAVVDEALERLERMAAAETKSFRRYFHRTFGPRQKDLWTRFPSSALPGSESV